MTRRRRTIFDVKSSRTLFLPQLQFSSALMWMLFAVSHWMSVSTTDHICHFTMVKMKHSIFNFPPPSMILIQSEWGFNCILVNVGSSLTHQNHSTYICLCCFNFNHSFISAFCEAPKCMSENHCKHLKQLPWFKMWILPCTCVIYLLFIHHHHHNGTL